MNNPLHSKEFNPSGVGLKNGNFIGLPFNRETAKVILIPVPWDVTVSYDEGTAYGPEAILDASVQLDLYDPDVEKAWEMGIYMHPVNESLLRKGKTLRAKAAAYIDFLERGGRIQDAPEMRKRMNEINEECGKMNDWVYNQTKEMLEAGKLTGVVGGDHSVPLGFLNALGERYSSFGILQFDAHFDLRDSYEGFTFSHASVFFNALKINALSGLVQVGIRDYCEEEVSFVKQQGQRVSVFYDHELKQNRFCGVDWNTQCNIIVNKLPQNVYISFDIDALDPKLCPHTGTPVPGGMEFTEATYLLRKVVESGRKIIGFDLCETGNSQWDANVGARILYKLSNLAGRSQGMV